MVHQRFTLELISKSNFFKAIRKLAVISVSNEGLTEVDWYVLLAGTVWLQEKKSLPRVIDFNTLVIIWRNGNGQRSLRHRGYNPTNLEREISKKIWQTLTRIRPKIHKSECFYAVATSTGYAGRRPLPWLEHYNLEKCLEDTFSSEDT